MKGPKSNFDQLIEIMAQLRGPEGCPWDREQTHESLVRYLVEESAELVEAMQAAARNKRKEEAAAKAKAMEKDTGAAVARARASAWTPQLGRQAPP